MRGMLGRHKVAAARALLPHYVSDADREQIEADARKAITWSEPPEDLVQEYRNKGCSEQIASQLARRFWQNQCEISAIHRALQPVVAKAAQEAIDANHDIKALSVWNFQVLNAALNSRRERAIGAFLEMLRRANGHDASTVKHTVAPPDIETLKKWKADCIRAGLEEFEQIDLGAAESARQLEPGSVVVVDVDAAQSSNP